jgi:hypothetical protein
MVKFRLAVMLCIVLACLFVGGLPLSSVVTPASREPKNEQTIWALEQSYWRYVQENNLPAYLEGCGTGISSAGLRSVRCLSTRTTSSVVMTCINPH